MMRQAAILFLAVALFSCNKDKKVVNRMEGTWKLTDVLLNDGTHVYPDETHVFGGGTADDETYLDWTKYTAGYADTIYGKYLVKEKGMKIIFHEESVSPAVETICTMEDMDRKSLIIRSTEGVLYFEKH